MNTLHDLSEAIVRDLMHVYVQNDLITEDGIQHAIKLVEHHLRIYDREKRLAACWTDKSQPYGLKLLSLSSSTSLVHNRKYFCAGKG